MSKLGVVEDTLFVPMLGRIYASEHCPQILYDQKALELKKKLPSALLEQDKQGQYTLIASAARLRPSSRSIAWQASSTSWGVRSVETSNAWFEKRSALRKPHASLSYRCEHRRTAPTRELINCCAVWNVRFTSP